MLIIINVSWKTMEPALVMRFVLSETKTCTNWLPAADHCDWGPGYQERTCYEFKKLTKSDVTQHRTVRTALRVDVYDG